MINTNIKNKYHQQTTGFIQRLNNDIRILLIGVIIPEKFLFVLESVFVCCLQFFVTRKTISCQTDTQQTLDVKKKHISKLFFG